MHLLLFLEEDVHCWQLYRAKECQGSQSLNPAVVQIQSKPLGMEGSESTEAFEEGFLFISN